MKNRMKTILYFLAFAALGVLIQGCCDPSNSSTAPSIRYVTYLFGDVNGNIAAKKQDGSVLPGVRVRMVVTVLSDEDLCDADGEATLEIGPWEMKQAPDTITVSFTASMDGYQTQTWQTTVLFGYTDVIQRVDIDRDVWGNTTSEKHITNYIYEVDVSHTFIMVPIQ